MNTISLSLKEKSNSAEISKKVYKQGEIEYNIYNYNNPSSKLIDFGAAGYPDEIQFNEQLSKQLN